MGTPAPSLLLPRIEATLLMQILEQTRVLLSMLPMPGDPPPELIALGDALQDRQVELLELCVAAPETAYSDPEIVAAMREITCIEGLIDDQHPMLLSFRSYNLLSDRQYQKDTFKRIRTQVYYPTMRDDMAEFRAQRNHHLATVHNM